ncbi:MAG: zinc-binding dehydrogenase [Chloroflexota bacterium]
MTIAEVAGSVEGRAAWFTAPRTIELRHEVVPPPGPGEVLVRLRATAICTLEQRIWRGVVPMYPVSPGHEPAGEVVAIGEGVVSAAPGDHVVVSFLPRCWQCHYCRIGESDKCSTRPSRAADEPVRFGGFAEHAIAQAYGVFRVDPTLDWAAASIAEPLACVVHSVKSADLGFGEDVVVVGAGTMGQLHVLLASRRGCRVLVSEPDPAKRAIALEHGAAAAYDPARVDVPSVIRDETDGRGADAIFVTAGGDAGRELLPALRRGGRAIFYTAYYPPVEWPLEPDWVHGSQVRLIGSVNQTQADWLDAARLLSKRIVDVSHLVSARVGLDELPKAMERATTDGAFRVVVEMAGGTGG